MGTFNGCARRSRACWRTRFALPTTSVPKRDRVQHAHDEEVANLEVALESRDIIGQAKGIIMVTMHCDADRAFQLLVTQSQAENRKLVDVAGEIAAHVARRVAPS